MTSPPPAGEGGTRPTQGPIAAQHGCNNLQRVGAPITPFQQREDGMKGRLTRALSGAAILGLAVAAAPLLAEGPTGADLMNDAARPGDVLTNGKGPQGLPARRWKGTGK